MQIWGHGSRVTFYKGSQAGPLNIQAHHDEMLEIPFQQLDGYERVKVDMEEGGL